MSRDIFTEAYGAMRHDLRKTLLTMLGMAWGIATVVLLLAYGEGFGHAIRERCTEDLEGVPGAEFEHGDAPDGGPHGPAGRVLAHELR